ncbi:MAG: hypothetical protein KA129_03400 [Microthrixaceae bacterium]|nr:hypothetical protein [Microthrixaceae bacterium]
MALNTQLGIGAETTYGTAVTVTRFQEFLNESIKPVIVTSESEALRASGTYKRTTGYCRHVSGYDGSVSFEPLTKGFGIWLKYMLGTVATGAAVDSAYEHTFTSGSLCGANTSFTMQVNRPLGACGTTPQAFTYISGKVASWKLSMSQGGFLVADVTLLFADGTTATGLATASYPVAAEAFCWGAASVTVGGTVVPVTEWAVEVNNNLKDDRRRINGGTARHEPVRNGIPMAKVSFTADWENLTHYDALTAGTLLAFEATATSPTLIGATSTPRLQITMPKVRIDEAGTAISGVEMLTESVSGEGLFDGTNQAITVKYRTADATP